jgi:hypothetical protein
MLEPEKSLFRALDQTEVETEASIVADIFLDVRGVMKVINDQYRIKADMLGSVLQDPD